MYIYIFTSQHRVCTADIYMYIYIYMYIIVYTYIVDLKYTTFIYIYIYIYFVAPRVKCGHHLRLVDLT